MANGSDTDALDPTKALRWLTEMGADEFIAEAPVDRFATTSAPLPARGRGDGLAARSESPATPTPALPRRGEGREQPPSSRPTASRIAGSEGLTDARSLAEACQSLDEIAEALAHFDACPLQRTATNLVYMDGNPRARVVFVGEAPGREEDLRGKPFIGRSGQLLDRMLAAIGLSRTAEDLGRAALITNVIYWRPPGNRKPTEAETLQCMPFVARTLALVEPEIIVCLGTTPAQRLLGLTDGILKLRGRWRTYAVGGREVPLLPTLHPAYLLRQPQQKRLAWRDFLALGKRLEARS